MSSYVCYSCCDVFYTTNIERFGGVSPPVQPRSSEFGRAATLRRVGHAVAFLSVAAAACCLWPVDVTKACSSQKPGPGAGKL